MDTNTLGPGFALIQNSSFLSNYTTRIIIYMANATAMDMDMMEFLMTMPSKADMLVPPFVLTAAILFAIMCLCISSRFKSSSVRRGIKSTAWTSKSNRVCIDSNNGYGGNDKLQCPPLEFLTHRDQEVIKRYNQFPNSFLPLLVISLPALLSLVFCPVTLFVAPHLMQALWPKDVFEMRPNINDAISCFLGPASLVYAIAFGFAMQNSMDKNSSIATEFREEVNCLRQIMNITMLVKRLSLTTKKVALAALKDATIQMMEDIISPKKNTKQEKHLWRLSKAIQSDSGQSEEPGPLDDEFVSEMVSRVLSLDSVLANGGFAIYGKIAWMQWLFLELLGFVSYFGILLVRGSSPALELTICMLTVFSISLFCYILADMDDPFHGFFRLDISSLSDLVFTMQEQYTQLMEEPTDKAPHTEGDEVIRM